MRVMMSKINFEQINENEVEVTLPPETPMEMVQQLTKSLLAKGLVEDLKKSTLSTRYFYRPQDKANELANKLLKSLEDMSGLNKADAYTKMKWAQQAQSRLADRNDRRAQLGLPPITMDQMQNPQNSVKPKAEPNMMSPTSTPPPAAPAAPATPSPTQTGPRTLSGKPNTLVGEIGYGGYSSGIKKDECDCGKEDCDICMTKSGYGPKGGGQYNPADNAKRKANNVGDSTEIGPNQNIKSYSSKPGQLSGKQSAALTARIQNAANKKQPVTTWTPEQIAAENAKRGLKKSWGQHLPFPSAEEEILKMAQETAQAGETAMANQLANMMRGKQMLKFQQPSQDEFISRGEAMGLGVNEEMIKAQEQQWGNSINNWMVEAAKPLSQRFSSEEEEMAYWNNIKVADKDDGSSGY